MASIGEEIETVYSEEFGFKSLGNLNLFPSTESLPFAFLNCLDISNVLKLFVATSNGKVVVGSTQELKDCTIKGSSNELKFSWENKQNEDYIYVKFYGATVILIDSTGTVWQLDTNNYNNGKVVLYSLEKPVVKVELNGNDLLLQFNDKTLESLNLKSLKKIHLLNDVYSYDCWNKTLYTLTQDKLIIYDSTELSALQETAKHEYPEDMKDELNGGSELLSITVLGESQFLLVLGEPLNEQSENVSYDHKTYVATIDKGSILYQESFDITPAFGSVLRYPSYYNINLNDLITDHKALNITASACSSELSIETFDKVIKPAQDNDCAVLPINSETDNDANPIGIALDFSSAGPFLEPCLGVEKVDSLALICVLTNTGTIYTFGLFNIIAIKEGKYHPELLKNQYMAETGGSINTKSSNDVFVVPNIEELNFGSDKRENATEFDQEEGVKQKPADNTLFRPAVERDLSKDISNSSQNGNTFETPAFGAPSFGAPSFGTPSFGTPSFGAPSFGAPSFGAPSFGAPSFGAPSFGSSSLGSAPDTNTSFRSLNFGSTDKIVADRNTTIVKPSSGTSTFGSAAANNTTKSSAFGNSPFGASSFSSAANNSTVETSTFGKASFASASISSTVTTNIAQNTAFGKPSFGVSSFGAAADSTTTQSTAFGKPSFGSLSSNSAFKNTTNQNTLFGKPSFGSLSSNQTHEKEAGQSPSIENQSFGSLSFGNTYRTDSKSEHDSTIPKLGALSFGHESAAFKSGINSAQTLQTSSPSNQFNANTTPNVATDAFVKPKFGSPSFGSLSSQEKTSNATSQQNNSPFKNAFNEAPTATSHSDASANNTLHGAFGKPSFGTTSFSQLSSTQSTDLSNKGILQFGSQTQNLFTSSEKVTASPFANLSADSTQSNKQSPFASLYKKTEDKDEDKTTLPFKAGNDIASTATPFSNFNKKTEDSLNPSPFSDLIDENKVESKEMIDKNLSAANTGSSKNAFDFTSFGQDNQGSGLENLKSNSESNANDESSEAQTSESSSSDSESIPPEDFVNSFDQSKKTLNNFPSAEKNEPSDRDSKYSETDLTDSTVDQNDVSNDNQSDNQKIGKLQNEEEFGSQNEATNTISQLTDKIKQSAKMDVKTMKLNFEDSSTSLMSPAKSPFSDFKTELSKPNSKSFILSQDLVSQSSDLTQLNEENDSNMNEPLNDLNEQKSPGHLDRITFSKNNNDKPFGDIKVATKSKALPHVAEKNSPLSTSKIELSNASQKMDSLQEISHKIVEAPESISSKDSASKSELESNHETPKSNNNDNDSKLKSALSQNVAVGTQAFGGKTGELKSTSRKLQPLKEFYTGASLSGIRYSSTEKNLQAIEKISIFMSSELEVLNENIKNLQSFISDQSFNEMEDRTIESIDEIYSWTLPEAKHLIKIVQTVSKSYVASRNVQQKLLTEVDDSEQLIRTNFMKLMNDVKEVMIKLTEKSISDNSNDSGLTLYQKNLQEELRRKLHSISKKAEEIERSLELLKLHSMKDARLDENPFVIKLAQEMGTRGLLLEEIKTLRAEVAELKIKPKEGKVQLQFESKSSLEDLTSFSSLYVNKIGLTMNTKQQLGNLLEKVTPLQNIPQV